MKTIKNFIKSNGYTWFAFDFDGVICIENPKYDKTRDKLGQDFIAAMGIRRDRRIPFKYACEAAKVNQDLIISEHINKWTYLNKNFIPTIKKIKNAGHKLCLATNNTPEIVIPWLSHYKLINEFDEVIFPEKIGMIWKPDIRYFQRLLKKLYKNSKTVFIDDQEKYLATARKAGLICYQAIPGRGFEFLDSEI
jgi:HAD superfamily hydrolase (TIGR01509 family)